MALYLNHLTHCRTAGKDVDGTDQTQARGTPIQELDETPNRINTDV